MKQAPVKRQAESEQRRERGRELIVALLRVALEAPGATDAPLARSLIEPLLACVLHADDGARAPEAPPGAAPADGRVARALELMRSRLADRWTVEALAKAVGLSRAAFARRFAAELGISPLRYLAERRLELAAELLAVGDDSLASIAAKVGYESEFAFSRAFKRRFGHAPGAFRRTLRAAPVHRGVPPVRALLAAA